MRNGPSVLTYQIDARNNTKMGLNMNTQWVSVLDASSWVVYALLIVLAGAAAYMTWKIALDKGFESEPDCTGDYADEGHSFSPWTTKYRSHVLFTYTEKIQVRRCKRCGYEQIRTSR